MEPESGQDSAFLAYVDQHREDNVHKKRIIIIVVVLIGTALVLAGCFLSQSAEPSPPDTGPIVDNAAQEQMKVPLTQEDVPESFDSDRAEEGEPGQIILGALLFNIDNFFETVGQGMEAAATEEGVEILFNSANTYEAEQNKILEDYVAQQVDAVLFSPIDEKTVSPPVKAVVDNGIHIVCFNGCFRDEAYQEAQVSAAYITDQAQLGANTAAIVAEWMAQQAIDTLQIGWVGCNEGCKPRSQGFLDALEALQIDWEVVDGQRDIDKASQAIGVIETLIQKHPEINIIFAENEGTTVGAVQAIERQGRAGEVFVFGTDISPQIAEMLLAEDNILQAVTAQDPYQMGYLAVKAAIELANGGEKQGITYVPGESFRRDQPEQIREYLAR